MITGVQPSRTRSLETSQGGGETMAPTRYTRFLPSASCADHPCVSPLTEDLPRCLAAARLSKAEAGKPSLRWKRRHGRKVCEYVKGSFLLILISQFLAIEPLGICTLNSERCHQIVLQSGYNRKSSMHGKINALENMDIVLIFAHVT